MSRFIALICDTERRIDEPVAQVFEQEGFVVHPTDDDAEAGYWLLMWNDPEELPGVALLSFEDDGQLLDFCGTLKQQDIVDQLPVFVLVDDPSGPVFDVLKAWGTIPMAKGSDLPARFTAEFEQLAAQGRMPEGLRPQFNDHGSPAPSPPRTPDESTEGRIRVDQSQKPRSAASRETKQREQGKKGQRSFQIFHRENVEQ